MKEKTRISIGAGLLFLICVASIGKAKNDPWLTPSSSRSDSIAPRSLDPLAPLRPVDELAPEALALDGLGRLFALDRARVEILRIPRTGPWVPFGVGDQGGPRFAQLSRLFARWGPDLFALDPVEGQLHHLDLDGHLRNAIRFDRSSFEGELGFIDPADFALSKSGELLLVDRASGRLLLFDRFGEFVTDLSEGLAGRDRLQAPSRIAQDEAGDLYLLDSPGAIVRRFSRQGEHRSGWRYDEGLPSDALRGGEQLAVTPWSQVVLVARDGSWIRVFTSTGLLLHHSESSELPPTTVTDMVAGPDSLLYLACPERGEIRRFRLIYPEYDPPGAP